MDREADREYEKDVSGCTGTMNFNIVEVCVCVRRDVVSKKYSD